jgi:hypothetical protein
MRSRQLAASWCGTELRDQQRFLPRAYIYLPSDAGQRQETTTWFNRILPLFVFRHWSETPGVVDFDVLDYLDPVGMLAFYR